MQNPDGDHIVHEYTDDDDSDDDIYELVVISDDENSSEIEFEEHDASDGVVVYDIEDAISVTGSGAGKPRIPPEVKETGSTILFNTRFDKLDVSTASKLRETKSKILARRTKIEPISSMSPKPNPKQRCLRRLPPLKFDVAIMIGNCSTPFQQQLKQSDVEHGSLALGGNCVEGYLVPLLTEEEIWGFFRNGITVTVYDRNSKEYEMRCRMMGSHSEAARAWCAVLYAGWVEFCAEQGLIAVRDYICVWIFRHTKTHRICFAILPKNPFLLIN